MFLIKWMPEAEQEYYSNLEFWINHNKSREYSLKIISKVEEIENILAKSPHIGRMTNSEFSVLKVVVLRKFYLYYKITENTVNILAFKATKEDHDKHNFGI